MNFAWNIPHKKAKKFFLQLKFDWHFLQNHKYEWHLWNASIMSKIKTMIVITVTPWAMLPWAKRSLNLRGFHLVTEKFELRGFSSIFLELRWFRTFKSVLFKEKSALFKENYHSKMSLNNTDLSYMVIFSLKRQRCSRSCCTKKV